MRRISPILRLQGQERLFTTVGDYKHPPSAQDPNTIVTANICGGLGNQLFQVANLIGVVARSSASSNPAAAMLLPRDIYSSSIDPNAPRPTYWDSMLRQFTTDICPDVPKELRTGFDSIQSVVIAEKKPPNGGRPEAILLPSVAPRAAQQSSVVNLSPTFYRLVGFFQSSAYFGDIEHLIKEIFIDNYIQKAAKAHLMRSYIGSSFVNDNDGEMTQSYSNEYSPNYSLSDQEPLFHPQDAHVVAMHVRRGDYLHHRDTFEELPFSYYDEALRQLLGPSIHLEEKRVFRRVAPRSDIKRSQVGKRLVNEMISNDADPTDNSVLSDNPDIDATPVVDDNNSVDTDQHSSRVISLPELRRRRKIKILIFSEDTAYASIIAGCIMSKYPGLDAMVLGSCRGC